MPPKGIQPQSILEVLKWTGPWMVVYTHISMTRNWSVNLYLMVNLQKWKSIYVHVLLEYTLINKQTNKQIAEPHKVNTLI